MRGTAESPQKLTSTTPATPAAFHTQSEVIHGFLSAMASFGSRLMPADGSFLSSLERSNKCHK